MKITFVTNIISTHQMNLWDDFIKHKDVDFAYLYTTTESEGVRYNDYPRKYCKYSKEIENIEAFLDDQDILIISLGSIDDQRINDYLKGKTNLFIYSEHISKNILLTTRYKKIKYFIKHIFKRPRHHRNISRNNVVLCSSSHAGYDYHITGFLRKNIYRFGYFPIYEFNNKLVNNKNIVFSGRNIYWKHPEDSLFALEYLSKHNNKYLLNIAGSGFKEDNNYKRDNVNVLGELRHQELIKLLFKSDLFIFSSTREEGWGVALLEAMAAGCFVIANVNAGSTRYVIKNGYNGLIYSNKKQLIRCLNKYSKLSTEDRNTIRKSAVDTVKDVWCAEVAADRLYELCVSKVSNRKFKNYKKGPLSNDPCIL